LHAGEGLDSKAEASAAFGLVYGYEPVTATVASAGIKDTTTGAIAMRRPMLQY